MANPFVYPLIVEIDTGAGDADTGLIAESAASVAVLNNDPALDVFVGTAADVAAGKGRVPPGTSKTFGGQNRPLGPLRWDANGSAELIITVIY